MVDWETLRRCASAATFARNAGGSFTEINSMSLMVIPFVTFGNTHPVRYADCVARISQNDNLRAAVG
jgi:hypothetical protein